MKSKTFPAQLKELDAVLAYVNAALEEADCPMKTQVSVAIAVEEIFVNIAHYAYAPSSGTAVIELYPLDAPRGLRIRFLDGGKPYNPLARKDPDVTLAAEERGIGGLGVYMVKKSMDDVTYEYAQGMNIFSITKYF